MSINKRKLALYMLPALAVVSIGGASLAHAASSPAPAATHVSAPAGQPEAAEPAGAETADDKTGAPDTDNVQQEDNVQDSTPDAPATPAK
jgi:hypothetical protein